MPDRYLLLDKHWPSKPANVQFARMALRTVTCAIAAEAADLIELAVGEACANAIEHGSPSGSANEFALRCLVSPRKGKLVIEVEDQGSKADISRLRAFDLPAAESEGGRGLFLIHQIMDEVQIDKSGKGVRIRMSKAIPPVAESTLANLCSSML